MIVTKKRANETDEFDTKIAIANWISEVFVHVKKDFHHPSLGHKINLEVRKSNLFKALQNFRSDDYLSYILRYLCFVDLGCWRS